LPDSARNVKVLAHAGGGLLALAVATFVAVGSAGLGPQWAFALGAGVLVGPGLLIWHLARLTRRDDQLLTHLRQAIETVSDGIGIFDSQERLIFRNADYVGQLSRLCDQVQPGISFERLNALHLQYGDAEDPTTWREFLARRLAAFRRADGTPLEWRLPDGHWVCLRDYRLPSGGTVVMRQDITESRRQQAELAQSESRFRDFADIASDWLWETDADDRFTYLSPQIKTNYGVDPDRMIGRRRYELGSSRVDTNEWRDYVAAIQTRKPFHGFEYDIVEIGDPPPRARISGRPIHDSEGRFIGYRGVGSDITAQTEAQGEIALTRQRLVDAIESISEGFALFDAEDRFVLCNSKYLSQYPRLEPFLTPGVTFQEVIEGQLEFGYAGVAAERGQKWLADRLQLHRNRPWTRDIAQGDGCWLRFSEYPVADGGTVTIFADISAIKANEQQLDQRVRDLQDTEARLEDQGRVLRDLARSLAAARDEAERASRAKSNFLASISHELRTPLNAIIGFSDILQTDLYGPLGDDRYRDYAGDINGSGQHLLSLINDILDLSKAEAGRLELTPERINLDTVIADCRRLIDGRAEAAKLTITGHTRNAATTVWADSRKLKQILLNLLSNAVKFTPPGGTITLTARDQANGVEIRVADTGIGMSEPDLAVALENFGQVDSDLARCHDGTGLGLPLTRSLVELHGGEFQLESSQGVGTTAIVWLPDGAPSTHKADAAD